MRTIDPAAISVAARTRVVSFHQSVSSRSIGVSGFVGLECQPTIAAVGPLEPGDVIFTGTPAGVGAGLSPPTWLKPGDKVRVEIGNIGTLENPVIAEPDTMRIG